MKSSRKVLLATVMAGAVVVMVVEALPQAVTKESRWVSPAGTTRLRVLLDAETLGGPEMELGEMTFQPGLDSGEHQHGAVEVFYVLEGELEHVVNGKSYLLKKGMAGYVRPTDKVRHKVAANAPVTKALVIWAPGGEVARIGSRWSREP